MEKTDVLVIGGSAAGIVAATTAKSFYADKSVMLIRKETQVLVPCGIPYIFGTLESSDQGLVPDAALSNAGVTLKIAEAISIDPENKTCKTSDGTAIGFEKLVLATGSTPVKPAWLKGADLENVYTIPKDKEYLDNLKVSLDGFKKVVVIGGGFIGVEMADELKKSGKDVTLVEMMPHVLSLAFDAELALKAEEILEARGVTLKTGSGIREINGSQKVTGITLNNDETLETDAVILSVGYRPNSVLAEKAGLKINDMGFIRVNEYMRTENPDIFAVGDCAEKHSFITRTVKPIMLASTSGAEARIAAMNLFKLSTVRLFGGTIAIFCTAIGDHAFGAAGVTENLAKERGFDILTATFEGIDRHPGTLPDTQKQIVKLVVSRESGILLGGEVMGGKSAGELINMIGFVIQNRMTVDALLTSQIGTHPLLTAPPTAYPLIKAAEMIAKKRRH
ncbi:MAG: FAD-dependent oxidoreductase [Desulfobacteraceae bacterium]|nr:FAD-dependent oxidoreductase [Desulfobacteraceae bacterium]MBC2756078.1 FAD-dependent oxidoreductase [Desulfobacteraceae bacterium]MBC2763764.1 FAD-dependent oxidoreductase [ANME-2 cluster archaeon]